VPNIHVADPPAVGAMADNSFDVIVANSVVQYWTPEELDAMLLTWRRLLAPNGQLVLADIIPPDASAALDAIALLRYAARHGFLCGAIVGLVRTACSPYRRLRTKLGITTFTEQDIAQRLRVAGFEARRLPYNFEHQPRRMTLMANPLLIAKDNPND